MANVQGLDRQLIDQLHRLDDRELLSSFERAVRADREGLAKVLLHIAEIDARKVWADEAYPSMFAFCVERYGFSEAMAYKRIRAARLGRRFPLVFAMVARGELHLAGIGLLAAHLTDESCAEVLARAAGKTTRQIEELVAELAPRPDAPSRLRRLPQRPESAELELSNAGGCGAGIRAGGRSAEASADAIAPPEARAESKTRADRGAVTPTAPARYRLQVTLDEEGRELLEQLRDLLGHAVPSGELGDVVTWALRVSLKEALKRKAAITDTPRRSKGKPKPGSRYVPADVKREVHVRDGARCTYVSPNGRRCTARRRLELDHVEPVGRYGEGTPDNVRYLCRAHNQRAADVVYGRAFMDRKRKGDQVRENVVAHRRGDSPRGESTARFALSQREWPTV